MCINSKYNGAIPHNTWVHDPTAVGAIVACTDVLIINHNTTTVTRILYVQYTAAIPSVTTIYINIILCIHYYTISSIRIYMLWSLRFLDVSLKSRSGDPKRNIISMRHGRRELYITTRLCDKNLKAMTSLKVTRNNCRHTRHKEYLLLCVCVCERHTNSRRANWKTPKLPTRPFSTLIFRGNNIK